MCMYDTILHIFIVRSKEVSIAVTVEDPWNHAVLRGRETSIA